VLHTSVTSAPKALTTWTAHRAHRPGGAVDEDLVTRLDVPAVTNTLERRDAGDGRGRSLLERQVAGLVGEGVLRGGHELGVRPEADLAVDLIAWRQARDARTHGLDAPGHVAAEHLVLGSQRPCAEADEQRPAREPVPVADRHVEAWTRTNTSPSLGCGASISRASRTSGCPYRSRRIE
jgi:hypothetical protein